MAFSLPTRLVAIEPSQIRENMRIAQKVGAINLAQGRPDFATAPEIKQAAIAAIEADHNQYSVTWGLAELREAVANMLHRRFELNFYPETEITITCGVTEAIVAAMLSLLEPGDEVIVPEPAHENYVPAICFAGGVPKFVTMRPPGFELCVDELKSAISPKTRLLVLNTPHNPSGRVFTREELQEILKITSRNGVLVLTDEIYDQVLYPPHEHTSVASVAPNRDLVITTGGISKTYATTGWRLGYIAASSEITHAIRTVHDYLTICAPTPFQHAALVAYTFPDGYYDHLRREFLLRRDCLMEVLRIAGFEAYQPQGAYYLLADFSRYRFNGTAEEFTRMLITDAKVATVPGTAFYYQDKELGNRLIRFAFAKTTALLKEAGAGLTAVFRQLTHKAV